MQKVFPCCRCNRLYVRWFCTSLVKRNRFRTCDSSFFKSWNPCMAYWLGFLFADGNIYVGSTIHTIQLSLKCIDYSHLEKYKKALQSTYQLGLYKNGESCKVSHAICNNSMGHDLIALGCIPRKSLTLEWPDDLPDDFASHFVRGYMDGDGCIRFCSVKRSFVVSFVGSRQFIDALQIYIKTNVLFNLKAKGSLHHKTSCSALSYNGNASSMTVLNWIYKDCDALTRLDRKHALYKKFVEITNIKPKQRSEEIEIFLNSHVYKTLTRCQYAHCCPQFHTIPSLKLNPNRIQQINKIDGTMIKVWENASTIHKVLGFHSGHILQACRGEIRVSAYGYYWSFVDI
eukprot:171868_1